LTPEIGACAQRHETTEIARGADTVEIVFAAEACRLRLVKETEEDAGLTAHRRLPIEPG